MRDEEFHRRAEEQERQEIQAMTPGEREARGSALPSMTVGDVLAHKSSRRSAIQEKRDTIFALKFTAKWLVPLEGDAQAEVGQAERSAKLAEELEKETSA